MKKIIFLSVSIMLLFVATLTAQPGCSKGMHQRMMGGKGMMGMMGMDNLPGFKFYEKFQSDLKLSDKQINKMSKIDLKFKNDIIDLKAEAEHAGLKMKEEISRTDMDKNAILSDQDNMLNVKNKIAKRVMAYKIDLYNVLTKEQKENSKTLRKKMMKNHRGSCKGMGMGKGKGSGQGMHSGGMMK